MVRSFRFSGLLLAGAALAGCASILGIDELSPQMDSGHGGAGSSNAGDGAGKAPGGSAGVGKGGTAGAHGGRSGGAAGSSNSEPGGTGALPSAGGAQSASGASGESGSAGEGGAHDATGGRGGSAGVSGTSIGGAGEAGAAGAGGTSVNGTVIDVWGHRLSGIPVAIGDQQTSTDSNGTFSFSGVPAVYDASVVVTWTAHAFGWIYQGLTLRNPTLQVYQAFDDREVELDVTEHNANFDGSSSWMLAFGSPNGSGVDWAYQYTGKLSTPDWEGPATNDWTIHGLVFDVVNSVPTAYTAYDSATETVSTGDSTHSVPLDLGKGSVASDSISGAVTASDSSYRNNFVHVRFASGATLAVVDKVTPASASFSYLVPDLPDTSISVAAASGNINVEGYAIAHQDGLAPGMTDVAVDIPAPARITLPADRANVTPSTTFTFTPGQAGVAHVVWIVDYGNTFGIYLVTNKTRFSLSDLDVLNGSFALQTDTQYGWAVQTHGTPASVDDMCGPSGFIDEYSVDTVDPEALYPLRASGSFTQSSGRFFTIPH